MTFPFINSEGRLTEEDLKDLDSFKTYVKGKDANIYYITSWKEEGLDDERIKRAQKINKNDTKRAVPIIIEYKEAGREKGEAKEELKARGIDNSVISIFLPESRNEVTYFIRDKLRFANSFYSWVGDAGHLSLNRGDEEVQLYKDISDKIIIVQDYKKGYDQVGKNIEKAVIEGGAKVYLYPGGEIRGGIIYSPFESILYSIHKKSESPYYKKKRKERSRGRGEYSPRPGYQQSDSSYPIEGVATTEEAIIGEAKKIFDQMKKDSKPAEEEIEELENEITSPKDPEPIYLPTRVGRAIYRGAKTLSSFL